MVHQTTDRPECRTAVTIKHTRLNDCRTDKALVLWLFSNTAHGGGSYDDNDDDGDDDDDEVVEYIIGWLWSLVSRTGHW